MGRGGNLEFLEGRWCRWRYAVIEDRRVLLLRGAFGTILAILKQKWGIKSLVVVSLELA